MAIQKNRKSPSPYKKPTGRPPLFTDPDKLSKLIDKYFADCDEGEMIEKFNKRGEVEKARIKIPYTVPGLALSIGLNGRTQLWEYKQKPEFANTILRALARIEQQRNEQALSGVVDSRFSQFDLNCNFRWQPTEKREIKIDEIDKMTDEEAEAELNKLNGVDESE